MLIVLIVILVLQSIVLGINISLACVKGKSMFNEHTIFNLFGVLVFSWFVYCVATYGHILFLSTEIING